MARKAGGKGPSDQQVELLRSIWGEMMRVSRLEEQANAHERQPPCRLS